MSFLLDDEDDFMRSFMRPLGDFHLRSALQVPNLSELKRGIMRYNERKSYARIKSFGCDMYVQYPARFLGIIFQSIHTGYHQNTRDLDEFIRNLQNKTQQLVTLEVNSLPKIYREGGLGKRFTSAIMNHGKWTNNYTRWRIIFMAALQYCISVDAGREIAPLNCFFHGDVQGIPVLIINSVMIILTGELIGIIHNPLYIQNQETGEVILKKMNRINIQYLDTLRLITDKISERDNVIISSTLGHLISPITYPSLQHVSQVLKIFDQGLVQFGNDWYKSVKMYEAILIGVTLHLKKTGYVPSELDYLQNTLIDVDPVHRPLFDHLLVVLRSPGITYHHLCQLHGLFRIWGHPVIDSLAGVEKMRKIGSKKKNIYSGFPEMLDQKFKERFFMSYYKKNRSTYPNWSDLSDQNVDYLLTTLRAGQKLNIYEPDYRLADWDYVRCEHTLSVPETFNLSLLVADTAISPTRTELKSVENDRRGALKPEWRRGVIKWIKDGVIDCMLLLSMINLCPTGLEKEWAIIGLYPKEREVNPVARMFSLMTLMMRAYFVVTEDMLSKFILPHFPNISMTLDLLSLTKKMGRITRRQQLQKGDGRTFCINIDFEKWNLNFRREVTKPLFSSIGRLFGMEELYNRTYDIFQNSLMYLSDGTYMPKFDGLLNWIKNEPNKAFEGHLGGNEGLRQKGWTIGTSLMLDITCQTEKIDYLLMGQGDNQVLVITVYSDLTKQYGIEHEIVKDDIKRKLNKFLKKLYQNSRLLGLPIKPLETWVSDTFFAYGKLPVFEGVIGCQSMKKLARCFPFSNEDIMTLDNALGSITATFNAACAADSNSLIPLLVSRFNQILAVEWFSRHHPLGATSMKTSEISRFANRSFRCLGEGDIRRGELKEVNWDIVKFAMLIIPKVMGGFNCTNLLSSCFRGMPDPLTHSIVYLTAIYHELGKNRYPVFKGLKRVIGTWLQPLFVEVPRFSLLFGDPYALCLIQPTGTRNITRKMVREQVKQISGDSVFAKWFGELVEITEDSRITKLVEIMSDSDRLFPRLCHSFIKGTIFGYAESVVSKVDKTVTLSRMTSAQKDIIGTIWRGETEFWSYFEWRCKVPAAAFNINCSTEYALELREFGWGKILDGVTSPCAYEVVEPFDEKIMNNKITIKTEVSSLLKRDLIEAFNGSSTPYLGSHVQDAQKHNIMDVAYGTDPLLSRPVSLLRTIDWIVKSDSNWAELIKCNLKSVTNFDVNQLIENDPLFVDNAEQKYNGGEDRGAMWNHISSIGSHISINTHLWEDSGSKGEILLQFQSLICMLQESFLDRMKGNFPCYSENWRTSCKRCLRSPSFEQYEINRPPDETVFPSFPGNPYLYIPRENVQVKVDVKLQQLKQLPRVKLEYFVLPERSCAMLITEYYALEFLRHLTKDEIKTEIDLAVLDLDNQEVRKIDIVRFLNYVAVGLWNIVYSLAESGGRVPNWDIDKQLIIKRLLRRDLLNYKGGLFWFTSEEILKQLREIKSFCPPSSYPIDPTHGLVSVRSTLLLYIRDLSKPPLAYFSYLVTEKRQDPLKILIQAVYSRMIRRIGDCPYCSWTISVIHWSDYDKLEDLIAVKCKCGHSLFPSDQIKKIVVMDVSWKEIVRVAEDYISGVERKKMVTHLSHTGSILEQLRNACAPAVFRKEFIDQCVHDSFKYGNQTFSHQYSYVPYFSSPISIPTRAYCRIYELMSYMSNLMFRRLPITVLGDGFGGSSIAIEEMNPHTPVNCWTLIDDSRSIPKAAHISKPPSHYLSYGKIKDLTHMWYGDVFSGEFKNAWKCDPSLISTEVIISEIELNHYPKEKTLGMTIEMVKTLLTLNKRLVAVKIAVRDYAELAEVIALVGKTQYSWSLVSLPLVDIEFGEGWLICERVSDKYRREWTIPETIHAIAKFVQERKTSSSYLLDISGYKRAWTFILETTNTCSWQYCLNDMSGWFFSVGISDWDNGDCTKLVNQIRNFKAPEMIADAGMSKQKYWFSEDAEALKTRLLVLALMRVSDDQHIQEILTRRNPFIIKWKRNKGRKGYPLLKRGGLPLSEEQVNVIVKYLAIGNFQIAFKRLNIRNAQQIGDEVPFLYVPKHRQDQVVNKVYFPISKKLSSIL